MAGPGPNVLDLGSDQTVTINSSFYDLSIITSGWVNWSDSTDEPGHAQH